MRKIILTLIVSGLAVIPVSPLAASKKNERTINKNKFCQQRQS